MTFSGFPEEALVFYEGLRADNTKAYWSDHKALYDRAVKAPMEALLAEVEPEFGPAKFFRPYRDVRFAKDKTPYKDHAGAVVIDDRSGALYVQLSADGLYVGGGYWHTQIDQAQRLREAVADDRTGTELQRIVDGLAGWEMVGERLKRLPKVVRGPTALLPTRDLEERMTGRSMDLAPELRLALLAACDAAAPRERGAARARRWRTRLTLGLATTAGVVAAYDALLLAVA